MNSFNSTWVTVVLCLFSGHDVLSAAGFVKRIGVLSNGRYTFDRGRSSPYKSDATHRHMDATSPSSSSLRMAMKVNIRIVGRKSSEPWLEQGVQMYETRLQPSSVDVSTTWHKDDSALLKGVELDFQKKHKVVCLDPLGTQTTSENFSDKLFDWLEEGGSRLSFVIGGAEGLPAELKYATTNSASGGGKTPPSISLSSLTFTHQFARLLLIEQIYRATEIRKGSGYHK